MGMRAKLSITIALAASGALQAWPDEVTFQALKDNTLYEEASGQLSNGAGDFFFAGRTEQGVGIDLRRGLLAFNVTGIPAGSAITSVQLLLECSKANIPATAHDVSLHRALANWGEGTSNASGNEGQGALATTSDATWLHTFYDTLLWASTGGDFNATASATRSVLDIGPYTWGSTPEMVADVQHWVDNPSQNFGWVIIGDESEAGTAKRFNTRENPNAGQRPRLVVNFDAPAGLTDFTPFFGTHISGTANSLRSSDNDYLRMRSHFGFTSGEANVLELRIGFLANTAGPTMRVTFEGRLSQAGGTSKTRVRNWDTNLFEQIDSFSLGLSEITRVLNGVSTTNRIRFADQRIELSLRQSVMIVFSAAGFDSFTDLTRINILP